MKSKGHFTYYFGGPSNMSKYGGLPNMTYHEYGGYDLTQSKQLCAADAKKIA